MPQSVPTQEEFEALTSKVDSIDERLKTQEGQTPEPGPGPGPEPIPEPTLLFSDDFSTPYEFTADNQVSKDGKWKIKYRSGGRAYVENGLLNVYPAAVSSPDQTRSTLIMTVQKFKDFIFEHNVKTIQQTRTGPSKYGVNGQGPQPWEVASWCMWSYNDEQEGPLRRSNHHYYFVLKTIGWEFGKKDNAPGDVTNEQQIFIKTGTNVKAVIGQSYRITINKKGFHFIIKVDGVTVVELDDPKVNDTTKMAEGYICLYEEDAKGVYDNVKIISNT